MRRALVMATVAALAVARPETYKEKEDFQYSRSSSDEGTKSGYYGAQRGNMGGNYERAHNMDLLAQHQMGGLVKTVQGELGDGVKQKSGTVFSSANSRGIYGSGVYDLSSVQGRNFQEGTSFGDLVSQSSMATQQAGYGSQSQLYSSAANSAYGSQAQNSRYRGYGYNTGLDQSLYTANQQSADSLRSSNVYDGALPQAQASSSHGSGYQSQSGYQGQSTYDQTAAAQHSAYGTSNTRGSHYRLVGVSPVRVYIRPGSTVDVPIAAQSYDASQGSSSAYNQNSQSAASTYNQNSISSDAEVLGSRQQSGFKPTDGAKHYESSYSYRKEWEKHDTVTSAPVAVPPTFSPYPSNSELYEDVQSQGSVQQANAQDARNVQSSSQYRGYQTKTAASRQAAYNSAAEEHRSSSNTAASLNANSNRAYDYGASADLNAGNLNSQVENFGSKPKSYQSSYSYHKSWERQGDPYVIKPSTNGLYTAADTQASQKLTSSSLIQASGSGSQRYGSHYHQGQQGYAYDPNCDCDENGHIRVARSYNLGYGQHSYQQSQKINDGQDYAGQQSQNLEDFGQQSQNLEDLGQQMQNSGDFGLESQNLQDFGQQPQNLGDLGQQSQNLEDFGQQSQNLENLGQQSENLEDLGQQSQNLEDLGQQSQNLEAFGQQSQNFGQETQNLEDFGQQTQNLENFNQQPQNQWDQQSQTDAGQQTQNKWNTQEHHGYGTGIEQQSRGTEHTGFNQQETEGSVSQINQFLIGYGLHSAPEKPNPLAHTIFNEHRPDQRKPFYWETKSTNANQDHNPFYPTAPFNQGFPDQQKYLEMHGNNQQSSDNKYVYNHVNTGYDQQYTTNDQLSFGYGHHHLTNYDANTNVNQEGKLSQYPGYIYSVNNKPTFTPPEWHNANTQNAVNTGFPWMRPQQPDYKPSTNYQNTAYGTGITYGYISNNGNFNHSTSNFSIIETKEKSDSTSLTDLWSMIDKIEKDTIGNKETDNSYHSSRDNKHDSQINSNSGLTDNFKENWFNKEDKIEQSISPFLSTTEVNIKITTTTIDLNSDDQDRGDIEPEKPKPQEEAGRGDIGPEDNLLNIPNNPLKILGRTTTEQTLTKTPEETESLTLMNNNKTTQASFNSSDAKKEVKLEEIDELFGSDLGVLSLEDQKKLRHHSEQDNWKLQSDIQKATSTTPGNIYYQQNINQQEKKIDSVNLQNSNKQTVGFDQLDHNLKKEFESLDQGLNQQQSILEQSPVEIHHNTYQHSDTLGQQTEDLSQQSYNQFDDLGQQIENFGHQSETFEQESLQNFGQQSVDRQGEHSDGFEQKSYDNVGQQKGLQDKKQQQESLVGFGQQSETLQQESLHNLGQQTEDLSQQSFNQFDDLEQQIDHFGQQNEGLQQESLHNFGQQSETFQQESIDRFGSHNDGFHQESLGDVGQQKEGFQQESLVDFGQQSENLEQKQNDTTDQQSEQFDDLGQKIDHFGQQNEGLQQESLHNFGQQSETFQQESLDRFGPHNDSFHQESLGDVDQQKEGFQQESLVDFGQQSENLEQKQNINTDKQSELFQQESIVDFGQQNDYLGQELQQFSNLDQEKKNVQQESIGDFGQKEQEQPGSISSYRPLSGGMHHSQNEQQLDNLGQELMTLEQESQSQVAWVPNLEQQTSQVEKFESASSKEGRASAHNEPVVEPEFVTKKSSNVDTPIVVVSEKPSFWNKVGSKFSSAKDTVKSWFSSG